MFYQTQILLITVLLILGSYELMQLTSLGSKASSLISFSLKWFYGFILTKKAWRNIYKHQH